MRTSYCIKKKVNNEQFYNMSFRVAGIILERKFLPPHGLDMILHLKIIETKFRLSMLMHCIPKTKKQNPEHILT